MAAKKTTKKKKAAKKKAAKRAGAKRAPARSRTKRDKVQSASVALAEYQKVVAAATGAECVTLGSEDCLANVPGHVSTQSLGLDYLCNRRGIPMGRVVELFGPPHIGKSTILDHLFAEVQRVGGVGVLCEPETARDRAYSARLGVDPGKLQYIQFPPAEFYLENILETFYTTIDFWRENHPDVPVVLGLDALGGAQTREESQDKGGNKQPGVAAKVLREASRKLPARLANTRIAVVICNHEYQRIQTAGRVGPRRETYGGGGLRHLATLRIQLFSVGEWVKRSDGEILGRVIGAKLVKNRLGNPWGETRLAMLSGHGISNVWTLYQEFRARGWIVKSGSWSSLSLDGEILKFQGWSGLSAKCVEDPDLFGRLVAVWAQHQEAENADV